MAIQPTGVDPEVVDVWVPEHEPQPPSMHEDCVDPKHPVGYSALPPDMTVRAFSRARCTLDEATATMVALQQGGLQIIDGPWWDLRYWFWRVR